MQSDLIKNLCFPNCWMKLKKGFGELLEKK
jgi:hypothetical protein